MKKTARAILFIPVMILAAATLFPRAGIANHYILCDPDHEKCLLAGTRYIATRIPDQPGYNTSADAINASGAIAGNLTRVLDNYGDEENVAALVFSTNNTLTRIAVPGVAARASSINAQGTVVGAYQVNGQYRAFRFDGNATTDISLTGAAESWATAINDNGDVTGIASAHAFVLHAGSVMELQVESYAFAINSLGQLAGFMKSSKFGEPYHAFRYGDNGIEDLGVLGNYAYALGINARGDVVGETYGSDNSPRPFVFTQGLMRYVGDMHGAANGINTAGTIVGYQFGDDRSRAFISVSGTISALDDLTDGLDDATLVLATSINDAGQIAARACSTIRWSECFGVRLDPVPISR